MSTSTKEKKVIEFTEKERKMIIYHVLLPKNATEVEIDVFIDVCEKYGFDPLQKDIIFNKYESKGEPTVSYMVTKDAWLKHAKRQPNFKRIISGVVHENDNFELDLVEGTVKHKIVANRGQITGAWALMFTTDGEIAEYVNFEEYFQAFSGAINHKYKVLNMWDKTPSKMIEKTAISHLIKNQYPLGVMFSGEEDLENFSQPFHEEKTVDANADLIAAQKAEQLQKELAKQPKAESTVAEPTQETVKEEVTQEPAQSETTVQQSNETANETNVSNETVTEGAQQEALPLEESTGEGKVEETLAPVGEEVAATTTTTQGPTSEEPKTNAPNQPVYTFLQKTERRGNGGRPTMQVTVETTEGQGQKQLFAIEEMYNAFDAFQLGDKFTAEIEVQFGTVHFVRKVQRIELNN